MERPSVGSRPHGGPSPRCPRRVVHPAARRLVRRRRAPVDPCASVDVRYGGFGTRGSAARGPPARRHRWRADRHHRGVRQRLGRQLRVPLGRQPTVASRPATGTVVASIGSAPSPSRSSPRVMPCGSRTPRTPRCPGRPATDRVTATIETCEGPEGMAEAADAIWVACEGSDEVGRIDPGTDRMTGTTAVGNEPRFVVAAFGSVWSSNYLDGTLSRIDPASGKVTATIETAFGPHIDARDIRGALGLLDRGCRGPADRPGCRGGRRHRGGCRHRARRALRARWGGLGRLRCRP